MSHKRIKRRRRRRSQVGGQGQRQGERKREKEEKEHANADNVVYVSTRFDLQLIDESEGDRNGQYPVQLVHSHLQSPRLARHNFFAHRDFAL